MEDLISIMIYMNENDDFSDYMYNELVRINQELFDITCLRINKVNNLVIFNGAIMAVLIFLHIQFISNSVVFNRIIFLL